LAFGGCIAIGTVGRVAGSSVIVVVSDFDAQDAKSITAKRTDARTVSFFMVQEILIPEIFVTSHFHRHIK
jgi:hypothetical protein